MGSISIGQHSIVIPESSWSLHVPSLNSYLHSHCGKERRKTQIQTMEEITQ